MGARSTIGKLVRVCYRSMNRKLSFGEYRFETRRECLLDNDFEGLRQRGYGPVSCWQEPFFSCNISTENRCNRRPHSGQVRRANAFVRLLVGIHRRAKQPEH